MGLKFTRDLSQRVMFGNFIDSKQVTDAEAKATILWPPDVKSQLIRKDPDAGKD